MKRILPILLLAILAGCTVNHDISGIFTKRKYTKGFFNNTPAVQPSVASLPTLVKATQPTVTGITKRVSASATKPVITVQQVQSEIKNIEKSISIKQFTTKTALRSNFNSPEELTSSAPETANSMESYPRYYDREDRGNPSVRWLVIIASLSLIALGFLIAFVFGFTLTVLDIILLDLGVVVAIAVLYFLFLLVWALLWGAMGGGSKNYSGEF